MVEEAAGRRLVVPVDESVTLRQTVGYAVQTALSGDGRAELHFVAAITAESEGPDVDREVDEAGGLLERVETWAREDAEGEELSIETAIVGVERYLFSPRDYADMLADYVDDRDADGLILDPEYRPGATAPMLRPLEHRLENLDVPYEEAPVERPVRRSGLITPGGLSRYAALFGVSFLFYLILGDPTYTYDLFTGAVSALVVSIALGHVAFSKPPDAIRSPLRLLRAGVYVPYLLWEIVKANVAISAVILRPSLPIDPRLTRLSAQLQGGLPITSLANSITLTPGTLTVRADDQHLIVHTLIADAREDLFDGGLERGVRFVFYGRESMRISTPRERGDAEVLQTGGEET